MIRRFHPRLPVLLIALLVIGSGLAGAAVPQMLNHQGGIAVEGVNFNGSGLFKFALVNGDGSVTYWSNDGTSVGGVPPTAAVTLTVSNGFYAVLLGNTELTHMTAIAPAALEYADVRLRVWFNDGTHGFQQITPDQRLAAVPYSIHSRKALAADTLNGLLSGDVTGGQATTFISDATVTGKQLIGLASTTGTLSGTDTILSAIGKLKGNSALLAPLASPTFTGAVSGITAAMVGLGSVDNTSDANKPVSTAQQTALALKAPLASPTFTGTVTGITAAMVGLGSVDNTSDASKPVSTAQQTALALKAPLASPTFTGTVRLPAGTTTAAPMIFNSGTKLATPVAGAVEFDGDRLYVTTSPATRKALAFADGPDGGIAVERLVAAPLSPVIAWGDNNGGQTTVPSLVDVTAVAAGAQHSLALKRDGSAVAWGSNASGQATVPAAALSGVTQIAAGFAHNVVCKSDGTVLAWGNSGYGRTTIPGGITTATRVAAGSLHSLALLGNGTVVAWGDSTFGQSAVPGSLTGVTAIAAGEFHSLALKSTGAVAAWGSNAAGQTAVPSAAASGGITAIAAGWNHSLALKSDGTVLAWGLNTGGQCTVPADLSGVIGIGAGDTYSMALKSNGTVVVWGFSSPVTAVPGGTTEVTAVAAGASHALALRADAVPVDYAPLDYAGRLGIGRVPATNRLEVEGNASKTTAGNWLANSDRRIKTEIETVTGALETLSQVRLVNFRYTPDYLAAHPGLEDRSYLNVIAQEFAEVFPDHVKSSCETMPDGSPILQVDTYPLTIFTAAAVQELQRENEALKAQLASQEQRLLRIEAALQGK